MEGNQDFIGTILENENITINPILCMEDYN